VSDQPSGTPEEHLQAAFDHLAQAARQLAKEARQALEPLAGWLAQLGSDPQAQARVRRHGEGDVAPACDCECADVHPGSWVCDMKAVTVVRRSSPAGPVEVPVCAPCAAEAMAQQI